MSETQVAKEYKDLVGHPYEWAEAQIKLEGYTVGRVDYHRGQPNTYHNRGADVLVFVGANNLVKDVRWRRPFLNGYKMNEPVIWSIQSWIASQ